MFSMLNAAQEDSRSCFFPILPTPHIPVGTTSWVFGCHKIRRKKIESGG
jgi:hypothetical protein